MCRGRRGQPPAVAPDRRHEHCVALAALTVVKRYRREANRLVVAEEAALSAVAYSSSVGSSAGHHGPELVDC